MIRRALHGTAAGCPLGRQTQPFRLSAVVVTGGPGEELLTAAVAGPGALDLGGRLDVPQLAAVIRGAEAVAVGNTGPAHRASMKAAAAS